MKNDTKIYYLNEQIKVLENKVLNIEKCYREKEKNVQNLINENLELKEKNAQAEELISSLLESYKDISTYILNTDFEYITFNEKHFRTAKKNWDVEIQRGMNIFNFITDTTYKERLRHNYQRVLKGEEFTLVEKQKTNHGWQYTENTYKPFFNSKMEIAGFSVQIKNITQAKQAENSWKILLDISEKAHTTHSLRDFLEKIHQNLGLLIDTTNFYVSLYHPDNDLYSFPYFYDEEDTLATLKPQPLPNSLTDYVRRNGQPLLANQEKILELFDAGEIELVGKMAKAWMGVPLKTGGNTIGVMVVQSYDYEDIYNEKDLEVMVFVSDHIAMLVERKHTEQELRESESRLKIAQSVAHIGNWQLNISTQTIWLSEEAHRILDMPRKMNNFHIGKIIEILHPDFRKNMKNAIINLIENGKEFDEELSIIRYSDKEHRILHSRAIIVYNENQQPVKVLGIIQDITKRKDTEQNLKEAKERAEEADKLKTAFLSNMSHEIRTPMNAIIGFSDLLNESDLTTEMRAEYIKYIQSSGNNLLNLIDDIIDIAKIEAGQIKIAITDCKINELINELKASYEKIKQQKDKNQVKIEAEIANPDENFTIQTDKFRLHQILSNFISNALKFTDKGYVKFGYQMMDDDQLLFFVEDTGIGIPKEKFDLIFKRFGQVDGPTHKLYGGTGLGLSIAKNLIELLDGEVWVESEMGHGTTFWFTIGTKTISAEIEADDTDNYPYSANFNWAKKTILIAEDEELNYKFVKEIISRTNAQVLWTKTGTETVNIVKDRPYEIDLILMDIQMPEMNGYEATKVIKTINPDIPVIAQTAYAMAGEEKEILKAGCNAYIAKPLKKNKLLRLINHYLTQK